MRITEIITESINPAEAWVKKVYDMYPDWPYGQADKVMVWGEGPDQQFAAFKLKPLAHRDHPTVELSWIMAGPEQRQGVGSRAIKELQRMASQDGIRLTLFPWAHGQVSQPKLMKLYKRHGFKPQNKGSKHMQWEPEITTESSGLQFAVHTPDNFASSFQITLSAQGKRIGHFNFVRDPDTDDVNNEAEVDGRFLGQGYGKLLLLKAIDVANSHKLDFQQDIRGVTDSQQRVYDSLESAGLIVTPGDGFWFLTPQGEQELASA